MALTEQEALKRVHKQRQKLFPNIPVDLWTERITKWRDGDFHIELFHTAHDHATTHDDRRFLFTWLKKRLGKEETLEFRERRIATAEKFFLDIHTRTLWHNNKDRMINE